MTEIQKEHAAEFSLSWRSCYLHADKTVKQTLKLIYGCRWYWAIFY